MATLNAVELQSVRNACAGAIQTNYTKPEINAISQAVEDWLVANAASVSAAIDVAKAGLTNAQKKKIVAEVLRCKFLRDR